MKNKKWIALLSMLFAFGAFGVTTNDNTAKNSENDAVFYAQSELFSYDAQGQSENSEILQNNESATFAVEYYFENSDGSFVLDEDKSYVENGVVGETVIANAIDSENYVLVDVLSTTSKTLSTSNNVLKVYYGLKKCDFTVKYYFENVLGEYEEDVSRGYSSTETIGKIVKANNVFTQNYELNEALSTIESTCGDGTELSVYYSLKSYRYSVRYYLENNGEYVLDENRTVSSEEKFGKTVSVSAQSIDGYTFNVNASKNELTVNEKNNVLYLYYAKNEEQQEQTVSYEVEYYFETANGSFNLDGDLSYTNEGVVGDTVNATLLNIDGYTLDDAISLEQKVLSNGGNLLRLYYVLNEYEYSVKYYFKEDNSAKYEENESFARVGKAKYTTTVNAQTLQVEGYTFNENESSTSCVIDLENNELALYYDKNVDEVSSFTVNIYYENANAVGFAKSSTQNVNNTTLDALLSQDLGAKDNFYFYRYDCNSSSTGYILHLYYKREMVSINVEYFFEENGAWIKNESLNYACEVKYGSEFITPIHSVYQNRINEEQSTLYVSEVLTNSTVAVYYGHERHEVKIDGVSSIMTSFKDDYEEVIASSYVAKLYNEREEFEVEYSDGSFNANLVNGEYNIEITSSAFSDKYKAKIYVNDGIVSVEPISLFSTLSMNNGGTTNLNYDETCDVWANNGQDATSFSYITATASANVVASVTVTARMPQYVVNQNWKDSEHAVGLMLVNSQNPSSTVFIGLYKNGVKVKANGLTSTITNTTFKNFTQSGSQSSESSLSVARLSNGEIYIYRDGKYLGWITSDGWCNGVKLSDTWLSYLGDSAYVATYADAPIDYKEFVFSDIEYSFTKSVVDGFKSANYTFEASDGFNETSYSLHRQEYKTITATINDGQIVKGALVNGENYLNGTVSGNQFSTILSINAKKYVRLNNSLALVYEDKANAIEVTGRVKLSDWLSMTDAKIVKLVSEYGITYQIEANDEGVYNALVPQGNYVVYASCGNYISSKQNVEIKDNCAINLIIDQYNLSKYAYSGQDDLIWVYEDENAITFNGRINSQKVENIFARSYEGNFAYSIDMIQAWNNAESKFNTTDDISGVLIRHSSGKYLGFYVETARSRIRMVSGNGSWNERLNVSISADLYRKTNDTAHTLSVVKNNGAIYFLIDGKVHFAFDGTKILDSYGEELTAYESFSHSSGKTTFEILNETVTTILNGGSITAGVGGGFNNAVLNTVDKSGYKNAIITQKQEVIDALLVAGYGVSVEKDENATVTLVSEGYDKINGVISQNSDLRVIIETKEGYALDYVWINGVDVYLKPYSKVYSIDLKQISKDTKIKIGTKEESTVTIKGKLIDSTNYKRAIVTYYSDSVVYTATPDSEGNFVINGKGTEGSVQVVYADGKIRNIQIEAQDGVVDLGSLSPIANEWSNKDWEVEAAMDVVASDDSKYLFAIGTSERSSDKKGHFYVYSVEENKVVASLEDNLGNCRQIAYENGYCYVTARDDGMWVIDVTDYDSNYTATTPNEVAPKLVYHYDSLEMATGIIVHDNTVFIANRQYGVEVVDVSNPYKPQFVTKIQTGEVQSLDINNGLLFAGIWGQQQVLVVDVSDIHNAQTLYSIPLDGRGDGVFVEDGYLYAATGHHAKGDYSTSSSPAWGLGNGLEVFKVDKNGYDKVFGVKFDKGYEEGFDLWEAVKAGNYVYVTNTFNGTFVYDVTDVYNPIQVAHMHCDRSASVSNYPNNATSVTVIDGSMFITGGHGGLFRYDNPDIKAPTPNSIRRGDVDNQSKIDVKITASGLTDYEVVKTEGQVRSIVVTDKYVVTANGNEGINVYDKTNNELVNTIKNEYLIKELLIDGNYLYSAEDAGGLAIYDLNSIQNANVEPLYRYDAIELGKVTNVKLAQSVSCNNTVAGHPLTVGQYGNVNSALTTTAISEIRLSQSGDKKYMLMHAGGMWVYIADVTDIANVKVVYKLKINGGLMYGRNLAQSVIEDKYFAVSANSFGIVYINIDGSGVARNSANTDYMYHNAWRTDTTASKLGMIDNGITTMTVNGEDKVIFVTGHGYRILDREVPSIYDNPIYGNVYTGWPKVLGDILVSTHRIGGAINVYDISDVYNPIKLGSYETNASPDIATRDGNKLYVPIGYYGFMVINLD